MQNHRPATSPPAQPVPVEGPESSPQGSDRDEVSLPIWNIVDLMHGSREAQIIHAGSTYRLRITAMNRLILTK